MKFILVVDDDPTSLSAINQVLKGHFKLAFCADSLDATDLILKLKPDMVLTDNQMPGMSGVELTRWIRSNDSTRSLPIVIVSGSENLNSLEPCQEAGANLCLDKANLSTRLIDALDQVFKAQNA